ncbi:MAG TPA: hypothetical protein VHD91_02395 [Gaiellaceae bacterium]|nr:hypothetical protein [Gaiellaceae bacterium]
MPELAVEGELPLEEAFVGSLDDVEAIRAAFHRGEPVVVRASSAEEVKAALARPEVACAVVPEERRDLLELDLTELTYG